MKRANATAARRCEPFSRDFSEPQFDEGVVLRELVKTDRRVPTFFTLVASFATRRAASENHFDARRRDKQEMMRGVRVAVI